MTTTAEKFTAQSPADTNDTEVVSTERENLRKKVRFGKVGAAVRKAYNFTLGYFKGSKDHLLDTHREAKRRGQLETGTHQEAADAESKEAQEADETEDDPIAREIEHVFDQHWYDEEADNGEGNPTGNYYRDENGNRMTVLVENGVGTKKPYVQLFDPTVVEALQARDEAAKFDYTIDEISDKRTDDLKHGRQEHPLFTAMNQKRIALDQLEHDRGNFDGAVRRAHKKAIEAARAEFDESRQTYIKSFEPTPEDLEKDTLARLTMTRATLAQMSFDARKGKIYSSKNSNDETYQAAKKAYQEARDSYFAESLEMFGDHLQWDDAKKNQFFVSFQAHEAGAFAGEEAQHYITVKEAGDNPDKQTRLQKLGDKYDQLPTGAKYTIMGGIAVSGLVLGGFGGAAAGALLGAKAGHSLVRGQAAMKNEDYTDAVKQTKRIYKEGSEQFDVKSKAEFKEELKGMKGENFWQTHKLRAQARKQRRLEKYVTRRRLSREMQSAMAISNSADDAADLKSLNAAENVAEKRKKILEENDTSRDKYLHDERKKAMHRKQGAVAVTVLGALGGVVAEFGVHDGVSALFHHTGSTPQAGGIAPSHPVTPPVSGHEGIAPSHPMTPPASGNVHYTVKPGDTSWNIVKDHLRGAVPANQLEAKTAEIVHTYNLPSLIRPGDVIDITLASK